ncbi:MAG: aminotransferase class V-fold PLP-dependent enzyme [Candidatus Eisenbacteria bacterium]|uniref:Aminotransferase class V-fold PLP-dependent enzyme n=1 Tax=Eiseniibacteriota bacterium TaxID=2212470 RepID=A0A538U5H4_UNCEI|nr:MAG: aminotransferase class V-fold PLP-dependent enzyme [Candidatus Eisenbacteria bacterium]
MSRPAPPAREDRLLEWRAEFPTTSATLHFISHSLGAMPRAAEESLRHYAETWTTRSIRAWEEQWFDLPARLGDTIASIVGGEPGTVSIHPNTTLAQAAVLSALEFLSPRNRLVCTAEDFPSMLYLYEGLARRGVEVVRVPPRAGQTIDERDVVAAVDERTALVAISHVLFRTSQVLDIAPIVRRARETGALVMLDAYQAVGAIPVDVRALDVDMLAGGTIKWLCGGPGVGYLYVRPRLAPSLRPALTGWMGHERPFDFDPGPMRWSTGARQFQTGTPSIPAVLAARPGTEIVAAIGAAAIREKSLRLTERLIGRADAFGFPLVSPREPDRRGGTVVLDVPDAAVVCRALLRAEVMLDHRPDVGLRLAPHFYTREDEVDEVMERVRDEVRRAAPRALPS